MERADTVPGAMVVWVRACKDGANNDVSQAAKAHNVWMRAQRRLAQCRLCQVERATGVSRRACRRQPVRVEHLPRETGPRNHDCGILETSLFTVASAVCLDAPNR
jgi:hypothetical protein